MDSQRRRAGMVTESGRAVLTMEGPLMAVEAADADVAPPGAVRGALRDTWTSLRSVFVNPALRRIELALAGSMIGDWAYATAIVVWAYGEGGAHLVGVWGAVRLLLMAFAAPIGSTLADRLPRKAVLIGSDLTAPCSSASQQRSSRSMRRRWRSWRWRR